MALGGGVMPGFGGSAAHAEPLHGAMPMAAATASMCRRVIFGSSCVPPPTLLIPLRLRFVDSVKRHRVVDSVVPALVGRTVDRGRTAPRGAILRGRWAEVKDGE